MESAAGALRLRDYTAAALRSAVRGCCDCGASSSHGSSSDRGDGSTAVASSHCSGVATGVASSHQGSEWTGASSLHQGESTGGAAPESCGAARDGLVQLINCRVLRGGVLRSEDVFIEGGCIVSAKSVFFSERRQVSQPASVFELSCPCRARIVIPCCW